MGGKVSKQKLNEALQAQMGGHGGVSFVPPSDEDDVFDVLTDAFQSDPMCVWIAGLEEGDPEKDTKMRDLIKSMMAFVNHRFVSRKRGVALGIRSDDGKGWIGCMTIAPSSCARERMVLDFLPVVWKYGAPPVYKTKEREGYSPHAAARMDHLGLLTKKRGEHMKDTERWLYLQTIGVRTGHHGKGHGKKMLNLLIHAAKRLDSAIYLETESAENEALYHHFGFRTLEKPVMKVKGDDTPTAELTMYLMRKDP